MNRNGEERSPWKGLVAGLAGGAVASFLMNQFQELMADDDGREQSHGAQSLQPNGHSSIDDDATERLADRAAKLITKKRLNRREKHNAGKIVHYAYGTLMGGAYGLATEYRRQPSVKSGMAFGSSAWAFGDEVAVPLLGLSKGLGGYPVSTHIRSFGSHMVYGFTTEVVRRSLRRLL